MKSISMKTKNYLHLKHFFFVINSILVFLLCALNLPNNCCGFIFSVFEKHLHVYDAKCIGNIDTSTHSCLRHPLSYVSMKASF